MVPYPGTNVAIWSLVNEFWYYIAFPFAALAILSRRAPWLRVLYALAAGAVLVFTGTRIAILFPVWLMGAVLPLLPRKFTVPQARAWSVGLSVLLLITMGAVRRLHMWWVPAEYLIGVITAVFLYAVVQQTQPAGGGIYQSASSFFSRISYTLYLVHVPMAMFLCGLIDTPWHPWAKTPKNILSYALTDGLIVFIAWGLWHAFEANTDKIRVWLFEREHVAQ